MYSPQVVDHFEHPRNSGELPNATVTVVQENPACGDVMQLALRVEGDVIRDTRFKVRGCVTAISCGSYLAELLVGMSLENARRLKREQMVASLGGLSNETMHASHLAMETLAAALRQL